MVEPPRPASIPPTPRPLPLPALASPHLGWWPLTCPPRQAARIPPSKDWGGRLDSRGGRLDPRGGRLDPW